MRFWRIGFGILTAVVVGTAGVATMSVAAAPDHDEGRLYLALGDSVAFGYITQAGFEYTNPDNFLGYSTYLEQSLNLDATNAACPGETTGSFLSPTAPDNGCRDYRAHAPLHAPYTSTQLEFATRFLRSHPQTRLVTITLGANDLFLVEAACNGDLACVAAALPATLATVTVNVQTILAALRATGYSRSIVVANYYSLDYTDAARTQITHALDTALKAAAVSQGALVADDFTTFAQNSSTPFAAGSPCRAGLLNALPANQFLCDVHPSQSGQRLIGRTVAVALGKLIHVSAD